MSTKANNYYKIDPNGPNLKDYQHASRLFVDDNMRLVPKQKFLYHVVFNMNSGALSLTNQALKDRHQTAINMLVKTADLPKFTVQTDTLNQYNRKKNTQVKVDYDPVSITFHDDNDGVTRQLWEAYFKYYYADSTAAESNEPYFRNAMKGRSTIRSPYGLDNNSFVPFFNNITIYQLSQRRWNSYKLINPIIQSWQHDSLDYSASAPAEQKMMLAYEAVAYDTGFIPEGSVPGFGFELYDNTPSAASIGKSVDGTLQGINDVFGSVSSGRAFADPKSALATAIVAVNTYQNIKDLSSNAKVSAGDLATAVAIGAATAIPAVQNVVFPVINTVNNVQATARNVNNTIDNFRNLF